MMSTNNSMLEPVDLEKARPEKSSNASSTKHQTPTRKRQAPLAKQILCDYPCFGNENDCGVPPCYAFWAIVLLLIALFSLGLGLLIGGIEVGARGLSFIFFWLAGAATLPWWCVYARRYSDDDEHGCGFGDYDEGPGNIMCMFTSSLLVFLVFGGVGASVALVVSRP